MNKTVSLDVIASEVIENVMRIIHDKMGYPEEELVLVFAGK